MNIKYISFKKKSLLFYDFYKLLNPPLTKMCRTAKNNTTKFEHDRKKKEGIKTYIQKNLIVCFNCSL